MASADITNAPSDVGNDVVNIEEGLEVVGGEVTNEDDKEASPLRFGRTRPSVRSEEGTAIQFASVTICFLIAWANGNKFARETTRPFVRSESRDGFSFPVYREIFRDCVGKRKSCCGLRTIVYAS